MKLWQLYKLLVKNLGESKQKVNGSEKFIAKLQKILKIFKNIALLSKITR